MAAFLFTKFIVAITTNFTNNAKASETRSGYLGFILDLCQLPEKLRIISSPVFSLVVEEVVDIFRLTEQTQAPISVQNCGLPFVTRTVQPSKENKTKSVKVDIMPTNIFILRIT